MCFRATKEMQNVINYFTCVLLSLGASASANLQFLPIDTHPHQNDSVHFICKSEKPLERCQIKPPNSHNWLNFTDSDSLSERVQAIQRGDPYLYYGSGLHNGDCGMVIPQPHQNDNGTWLCEVQDVGSPLTETREIDILVQGNTGTTVKPTLEVIPVDTQVDPSHSAVFLCISEYSLQACLIKSPDCTNYTSLSDSDNEKKKAIQEGKRFLYTGNGLYNGVCGAVIPCPKPEDSGIWLCKVQLVGESDFIIAEVNISVRVEDHTKSVNWMTTNHPRTTTNQPRTTTNQPRTTTNQPKELNEKDDSVKNAFIVSICSVLLLLLILAGVGCILCNWYRPTRRPRQTDIQERIPMQRVLK